MKWNLFNVLVWHRRQSVYGVCRLICTTVLTPILLEVIWYAMRERNFFQAERRNIRCLLSCSCVGCSCVGCSDTFNVPFNDWLKFFLFALSPVLVTSATIVSAFGSLVFATFGLFTRRDKRNGLRGIENARRMFFFFSLPLSFCTETFVATTLFLLFMIWFVCCCDCDETDAAGATAVHSFPLAIFCAVNNLFLLQYLNWFFRHPRDILISFNLVFAPA